MQKVLHQIVVEPVVHRNEKRLKLEFPYDNDLIGLVRRIPDCKWSKTMCCWHIPFKGNYKPLLEKRFNGIAELKLGKVSNEIQEDILMTENDNHFNISESLESFEKYLEAQRFSKSTVKSYISMLERFFGFIMKSPHEIANADINRYNNDYILKNQLSFSYQNQFINALKKYYMVNHSEKLQLESIERPQKTSYLPGVLSKQDIKRMLSSIRNIKHKTILSLIYSAGLRRSEIINLKPEDIDSKRMVINIRGAKGNKDRLVVLSENMLELIRQYYMLYQPKHYLFAGMSGGKYSPQSVYKIFINAKRKAGIKVKGGVHILRHSYATHVHENGTDIRLLQEILGHKSSKTTEIYTHVSTKSIKNVKSPLDDLY